MASLRMKAQGTRGNKNSPRSGKSKHSSGAAGENLLGTSPPPTDTLTPKQKPKKLSKRQARILEQEAEAAATKNTATSKTKLKSKLKSSKSKPKMGRSGNIAFGGHGDEWNNTPYAQRIGNNHLLRVKRENAARLRQLELVF